MKLLDTNVLIAYLRDHPGGVGVVEAAVGASVAACSVLTRVEIEGGMRSGERSAVRELFAMMQLISVNDVIAGRAGELKRTYHRSHASVDIVDYVIAATAQIHDAELMTLNVKHFPMFKGLKPAF